METVAKTVEKGVREAEKRLVPVPIMPSIIVGAIVALLIIIIGVSIVFNLKEYDGDGDTSEEEGKPLKTSKRLTYSGIAVVAGAVAGLIAGAITYNVMFAYYNPKTAAALFIAQEAVDIVT